jgi:hypothetical protein
MNPGPKTHRARHQEQVFLTILTDLLTLKLRFGVRSNTLTDGNLEAVEGQI